MDHPRIGGLGQRITFNYDRDTLRELGIGENHLPAHRGFRGFDEAGPSELQADPSRRRIQFVGMHVARCQDLGDPAPLHDRAAPIATNLAQVFDTSIAPDAIARILLDARLYPGRILGASDHWVALTYATWATSTGYAR